MSFIDSYLKNPLDQLPQSAKNILSNLENTMAQIVDDSKTSYSFDDIVSKIGPQVADLIQRFKDYFTSLPSFSLKSLGDIFRFVMNISTEVHQIMASVDSLIISNDMTDQQKHDAKVLFGQNLVYFIWVTVDPLKDKLNWLPFKKTVEKKVVFWIANMALQHAVDLFSLQSAGLKALPPTK